MDTEVRAPVAPQEPVDQLAQWQDGPQLPHDAGAEGRVPARVGELQAAAAQEGDGTGGHLRSRVWARQLLIARQPAESGR